MQKQMIEYKTAEELSEEELEDFMEGEGFERDIAVRAWDKKLDEVIVNLDDLTTTTGYRIKYDTERTYYKAHVEQGKPGVRKGDYHCMYSGKLTHHYYSWKYWRDRCEEQGRELVKLENEKKVLKDELQREGISEDKIRELLLNPLANIPLGDNNEMA